MLKILRRTRYAHPMKVRTVEPNLTHQQNANCAEQFDPAVGSGNTGGKVNVACRGVAVIVLPRYASSV